MKTIIQILVIISAIIFTAGSIQAGEKDPVAVLFQVKGDVDYSKDGKKWKKVRRNKFLFSGYQIRSAEDGSGKITIKPTGENVMLAPNSILEVTDNGLKAVQGDFSTVESSNKLVSGLIKKFSKSQSYTTVRRSAQTQNAVELDAVRSVVISDSHPYLVWDNLDKAYSYKLYLGGELYDVPETENAVVRVKLNPFEGTKTFKIEAYKGGELITKLDQFKSRGELKDYTVSWLESAKKQELDQITTGLVEEYGEDTFILGTYFEKEDMWVAAMDHYKSYLTNNPDDIEMTPYLFRVYKKLKLENIYDKELNEYMQVVVE
ncbi:hypothetical protein KJ966_12845 [bacterium]|nr:hypothetical protein [bacterium]